MKEQLGVDKLLISYIFVIESQVHACARVSARQGTHVLQKLTHVRSIHNLRVTRTHLSSYL